jgi:hypothetical protein
VLEEYLREFTPQELSAEFGVPVLVREGFRFGLNVAGKAFIPRHPRFHDLPPVYVPKSYSRQAIVINARHFTDVIYAVHPRENKRYEEPFERPPEDIKEFLRDAEARDKNFSIVGKNPNCPPSEAAIFNIALIGTRYVIILLPRTNVTRRYSLSKP